MHRRYTGRWDASSSSRRGVVSARERRSWVQATRNMPPTVTPTPRSESGWPKPPNQKLQQPQRASRTSRRFRWARSGSRAPCSRCQSAHGLRRQRPRLPRPHRRRCPPPHLRRRPHLLPRRHRLRLPSCPLNTRPRRIVTIRTRRGRAARGSRPPPRVRSSAPRRNMSTCSSDRRRSILSRRWQLWRARCATLTFGRTTEQLACSWLRTRRSTRWWSTT